MKKITLYAALIALLFGSVITAGPVMYVKQVSVTQTNTVVTPTDVNAKPTFVRVLNDGDNPIYVDFDRVAVAASTTAVKVNSCEGREFAFDRTTSFTTMGLIADTGLTATARVEVHYQTGVYPQIPNQTDRVRHIKNDSCTSLTLASDPELAALAGLTSAADLGMQFTGAGTAATFSLTAAAKTVLDDTTVGAMVDTLGGASAVGTGGLARANTPILVTPAIGAATGASVVLTGAVTAPGGLITLASQGQTVTKKVTLTEAGGAETVITLTSAAGAAFSVTMDYMVFVGDATPDYAVRNGSFTMVCVNKATAVSCTKDATNQTDDGSQLVSPAAAKTLTYAIAVDVGSANVATLSFDVDSDIGTVVGGHIVYTAQVHGTVTVS